MVLSRNMTKSVRTMEDPPPAVKQMSDVPSVSRQNTKELETSGYDVATLKELAYNSHFTEKSQLKSKKKRRVYYLCRFTFIFTLCVLAVLKIATMSSGGSRSSAAISLHPLFKDVNYSSTQTYEDVTTAAHFWLYAQAVVTEVFATTGACQGSTAIGGSYCTYRYNHYSKILGVYLIQKRVPTFSCAPSALKDAIYPTCWNYGEDETSAFGSSYTHETKEGVFSFSEPILDGYVQDIVYLSDWDQTNSLARLTTLESNGFIDEQTSQISLFVLAYNGNTNSLVKYEARFKKGPKEATTEQQGGVFRPYINVQVGRLRPYHDPTGSTFLYALHIMLDIVFWPMVYIMLIWELLEYIEECLHLRLPEYPNPRVLDVLHIPYSPIAVIFSPWVFRKKYILDHSGTNRVDSPERWRRSPTYFLRMPIFYVDLSKWVFILGDTVVLLSYVTNKYVEDFTTGTDILSTSYVTSASDMRTAVLTIIQIEGAFVIGMTILYGTIALKMLWTLPSVHLGLSTLTQSLSRSFGHLSDFFIVIGVLMLLFSTFGFVIFSYRGVEEFSTFGKTVQSMGELSLGLIDLDPLVENQANPAAFYCFFWLFVFFLVILAPNLLIAIISDGYAEHKEHMNLVGSRSFLASMRSGAESSARKTLSLIACKKKKGDSDPEPSHMNELVISGFEVVRWAATKYGEGNVEELPTIDDVDDGDLEGASNDLERVLPEGEKPHHAAAVWSAKFIHNILCRRLGVQRTEKGWHDLVEESVALSGEKEYFLRIVNGSFAEKRKKEQFEVIEARGIDTVLDEVAKLQSDMVRMQVFQFEMMRTMSDRMDALVKMNNDAALKNGASFSPGAPSPTVTKAKKGRGKVKPEGDSGKDEDTPSLEKIKKTKSWFVRE